MLGEEKFKRKQWASPRLIILTKGKPEEGVVLGMCKDLIYPTGPRNEYNACVQSPPLTCGLCYNIYSS